MHRRRRLARQRGIALPMAMIFVAMLGSLIASALWVAGIELRMADNFLSSLIVDESVTSLLTIVAQDPENFPLTGAAGGLGCEENPSTTVCSALFPEGELSGNYTVVRMEPLLGHDFPQREHESIVTGVGHFNTALFEVSAKVEGTQSRSGRAYAVQGVAIRVPAVGG